MGNTTRATFSSKWNAERQELTYRIGKEGTKAFLLFGVDDLPGLHAMLTAAMAGAEAVSE
jgi:hypothetical protein